MASGFSTANRATKSPRVVFNFFPIIDENLRTSWWHQLSDPPTCLCRNLSWRAGRIVVCDIGVEMDPSCRTSLCPIRPNLSLSLCAPGFDFCHKETAMYHVIALPLSLNVEVPRGAGAAQPGGLGPISGRERERLGRDNRERMDGMTSSHRIDGR